LTLRPPDPCVAGCRKPHVHRQVDDGANSGVPVEVAARGLAGTIVDNDDLEGLEGLRQDGLKRFVDVLLPVVISMTTEMSGFPQSN